MRGAAHLCVCVLPTAVSIVVVEALGPAFRELVKQIDKAPSPGYVSEHRWLIAIVDQPAMFTPYSRWTLFDRHESASLPTLGRSVSPQNARRDLRATSIQTELA